MIYVNAIFYTNSTQTPLRCAMYDIHSLPLPQMSSNESLKGCNSSCPPVY